MRNSVYILFFIISHLAGSAQQLIKCKTLEKDSATALPFVYIINKSNGNGTMSDNDGNFVLLVKQSDTLIFSNVGYTKTYIKVSDILSQKNTPYKIILNQLAINLSMVTVTAFKYKPYERQYMNDIIDRSKIKALDYVGSPISALYMQYSKEGRQLRKLAKIFEDILIEEQVAQKFNPDVLRKLTGDDKINFDDFRKFCYTCNNYYIINNDAIDVYSKIMDCYKRWKNEGR